MRVKPSALTGGSLPELKERVRIYSSEKEDSTLCTNYPVSHFSICIFMSTRGSRLCGWRVKWGKDKNRKRRTLFIPSSHSISALISSIVRKCSGDVGRWWENKTVYNFWLREECVSIWVRDSLASSIFCRLLFLLKFIFQSNAMKPSDVKGLPLVVWLIPITHTYSVMPGPHRSLVGLTQNCRVKNATSDCGWDLSTMALEPV